MRRLLRLMDSTLLSAEGASPMPPDHIYSLSNSPPLLGQILAAGPGSLPTARAWAPAVPRAVRGRGAAVPRRGRTAPGPSEEPKSRTAMHRGQTPLSFLL